MVNERVVDSCGEFTAAAADILSIARTAASTVHPTTKERVRKWNLEKRGEAWKINLTGKVLKHMSFFGCWQPDS
jgi:hypothetical protein